MKNSHGSMVAVIPVMLLTACVDNRNDFAGAALSAEVSAASALLAPENLSASASDNEVNLSWDEVDGASAYNVYMYDESGYTESGYLSANNDANDTGEFTKVSTNSHLVSSLEYEIDYYFNVTAVSDDLESGQSNEVGVRPLQGLTNTTPSVQLADTKVNANDEITLSAEVSDPDGNDISYLWQQTSGDEVNVRDRDQPEAYFTAPIVDAPADLEFVLTVSDDYGASNSKTTTVSVSDNIAPQVDAGADQSVSAGAIVNLLGSASDSDGSIVDITWQLSSGSGVSLSSSSTLATSFTAPSADSGELTLVFQLSVTDDRGDSATDTVTVIVIVNEAPIITSISSIEVVENSDGTIYTATANDNDAGDVLTYSLSGTDANDFTIDSSSGAVSFASAPDYENPTDANTDNVYEVNLSVSDDNGYSDTQELSFSVANDTNEAPIITNDSSSVEVEENNASTIYIASANDDDGDLLTYTLSGTDADDLNIDPSSGAISFVNAPDYEAPTDANTDNIYEITFEVADGNSNTTHQALTITVTGINEKPSVGPATTVSVPENSSGTIYTASAIDPENDTLTYTLSGTDIDDFIINSGSGEISFVNAPDHEIPTDDDANNVYELTLAVSDGNGNTASQALTISVTSVNEAPTITSTTTATSVPENSSDTIYTANATDPEDDTLIYSLSGTDANDFIINSSSKAISFANTPDYEAPTDANTDNIYQVTLEVSDGSNTVAQELNFTVTDSNEYSVSALLDDDATDNQIAENATAGTAVGITASASDADGSDSISYSFDNESQTSADNLFSIASDSGIVTLASGASLDYENSTSHELDIKANSSDGSSASAKFTVDVTDINEAPAITSTTSASVPENASGTIYSTSATDPENDNLTYDLSGTDIDDFIIDSSSGTISFVNIPDYEAPTDANTDNVYQLTLEASDGNGNTASQALTISVTDVNEAPTITSETSASIPENTSGTVYTTSATDPENDNLTYALSGTDTDDFSIDSSSGAISFANTPDHETPTDADTDNVYQLTLEVSDDNDNTVSQALTITVTDVNEIPTITSATSTNTLENTSGTIYTASATDPENDKLTYSLSGTDTSDFVIDSSNGAISFATLPNYESPTDADNDNVYQLTLEVSDDNSNTASQALAITVTDVNEAPTITSATSTSITENTSGIIYSASASDPENDTLTYSLSGTDKDDFIIDSSTGAISFANTPDHESPTDNNTDNIYQVTLEVSDANGNSSNQALTITVTDVNEAPAIISENSASVSENTSITTTIYTASATDPENDNLTYALSGTDTSDLIIDSSTGAISFINTPNYEAPTDANNDNVYQVTLQVSDDNGNSTSQALTISVTDVNEAPTITPENSVSITENTSGTVYSASATDPESDPLTYALSGTDTNDFIIDPSSGALSFANTPNYEAPTDDNTDNIYQVTLEVSDDNGNTASQALTISVTDVNEAPTITSENSASITENTSGTIYSASATDPENDNITYALSGTDTSDLIIDPSSGAISFINTPNYESPTDANNDNAYQVTLQVYDDNGYTTSQALTISVTDVNEEPTITSENSVSITENTSGTIYSASATDPEGDNLTYALSGTDTNDFIINSSSGALSFTNNPDYETPTDDDTNNVYQVTLEVSDSNANTASQELTISVTGVNEAPIITSATSANIPENNTTTIYTASATDPENNNLTYSLSGTDASYFNIGSSSGALSFTNNPDYETPTDADTNNVYQVTLQVSDDNGNTASQGLAISVTDVNEAPTITSTTSSSVPENTSTTTTIYTASATDPENDNLTYSLSGTDANYFNIGSSSGALSFTSNPDYEAPTDADSNNVYQVTLEVSDGNGNSASQALTISVTGVNESPAINSAASASVPENTSITTTIYTASATDPENDNLTYELSGADIDNFIIDSSSGAISFVAPPDYEAPTDANNDNGYQVTLEVSDGNGNSASQELTISVTGVNEVPTINSTGSASIAENTSTTTTIYTASATDPENDNLTYALSGTDANYFNIGSSSGALSFVNNPDYEAPTDADTNNAYQVTLEVSDSNANTASQELVITVTDVNEAPTITSATSASVPENTTITTTIYTASATDPENDNLTYSLSGTDADDFTINPNSGAISFANTPDHETPSDDNKDNVYQVTLEVSDGNGNSASQALTISVTEVNETPTITSKTSANTLENTSGTIYSASATDPENDTLAYSLSGTDQDDFIIDPSSGAIAFANTPNYESPTDADTNNVYQVTLEVSDGNGNSASQALTISVTNVNETPTITSATSASVTENTSTTTTIYTASATDPENDPLTYSLSGTDQDDFIIGPSSGAISFANTPDHETPTDDNSNNVYQVTLEVSDGNGNSASQALTITVTGVNEYPVSTPIDVNSTTNQIAENATAETPVGITVYASDADGTNNTVSYGFTNGNQTSDDNLFSVVPASGIVKLLYSNSLDYETATSHELVIKATSSDGSSATATFTINVTDFNEYSVSAPTDADGTPNQIAEDAIAGTAVGITAASSDADGSATVSYSFDNDNQTSADNLFSIASDTGVITLASGASLDHEAASSHEVVVKATSDDTSSATATFTIGVTDVDEHDVGTITDNDDAADQISEDASAGTAVGITASASDDDGTDDVSYSFDNDNQTSADNLFSIASDTGIVTLTNSNSLDYETATSHDIVIKATSDDTSTATATFTISVTDVDEHDVGTITDANTAANEIAEDAAAGTTVGITASASDADGTDDVSYSFANDSQTSADNLFSIASDTGVITLASGASLDHEAASSLEVVVKATSDDTSTATATFTISVTDVDEHDVGTITDSDDAADQIAENAAAGTPVGITASASDADGTDDVSYSFANDSQTSADALFSIASNTGVITLASGASLDHEAASSLEVVVKATSDDTSTATATFTISVTDVDEHDVGTITDANTAANEIAENATANTAVGITASASDADGTDDVSYSFDNDTQTSTDTLFNIAGDTGVITLASGASLDHEADSSHEVVVKATSDDTSTATATFTISVTDVDEHDVGTITDSDDAADQIAENAAAGTAVGITASASDDDGTDDVSYSFDNDNQTSADNLFSIASDTGVITLASGASLDHEAASSHEVVVKATSDDTSTATATFTISVTDVDEHDVGTITDANTAANEIAEDAAAGTAVGITASASDDDGTDDVSYSFDNDNQTSADNLFSIASDTGVITLASGASLDHEAANSHEVVVKATSDDTSTATATFTISVTDVDEHDVGTITDANTAANEIAEDAAAGTAVGITASASDDDGTNNTISYSFTNGNQTSANNLFSIGSNSGIVTLASGASLDYETAISHDIVIKATSSDGSSTTHTFTIAVTDVDEFDVIFATQPDADNSLNQIAEDAAVGTAVGITASASDADGTNNNISYSFDNDNQTSADNLFSIASDTGIVTLTNSNSLDYETATSHDIVIKATSSDGSTDSKAFTISVIDINDNAPVITASQSFSIAENSANGASVGTVAVSDADVTATTYQDWAITGGNTNNAFAINNSTGELSVADASQLDYETTPTSYNLTITVSDGANTSSAETVTINVNDINDNAPVITASQSFSVDENSANATSVGTVAVSDADATATTYQNWTITGGNTNSAFAIDSSTGEITVADASRLDYETEPNSYNLTLTVSDGTNTSSAETVTINVNDLNDNTPVITASQSFSVDENSANATSVGTVAATDADATATTYQDWTIAGGNTNSAFAIDSSSGEITVADASQIDYEATPTSYNLTITVSDGANTSSAETVTINVNDLNDNTPVITASQSFSVDENSANATSVGTVAATDADATATTYQDWTIAGGNTNSAFAIDSSTGEITVADASQLDYETAPISYNLTITVSDGVNNSSAETVTINVNDLNDNLPVITASQSFGIDENSVKGTSVGTVVATDADATATTYQDWTITGGNTNSAFAIDSSTGEITVADASQLDYETATNSYNLTITVSDGTNTSSAETVTININDLNDNAPVITASQSFNIDEASANGTSVGTVEVTDTDSDAVNTFTWSITGGNTNDAFAIDDSTGEITVATSSELDYESGTILYTLALTVSDGATTSAAEDITINILDVSEHDAAPSAAYLGLPDNYINITFTPESGVSYQLHRSFVEGCTSSSCDAEGYKLFASPNSSGTADTMTFSQTHYYSLVGDNSTTFTTSINDSDGAKLAALVAAQSLSTEYDLTNDWVNISATDSNNVTYTLYMAGEPFAAGGCEDSELDNIGSLCADGSSLSDGSMHSATEVINWSARRYYRLDISDGYQVVHSLESNASVIDPVVLNASNASLTIDITWSALNSSKLAEYTVYLSDDSAATTASAATWSSLSNPRIISGNSSELYSLVPILSQYYVAITATNTENETTPLSKVYLVNNIVTGDPDPSTWHEIIADTDDSPAHWEGRSTHASLVFQDKMWLIGGRTASENHIAEVWSSTDGYNWTEVTPSAAFGARKEFVSMVHDGKMWVLGGEIEGNLLANDVWYSSDGATWHEATPAASWHVRDYFGGVAFASGATGSDEMWVLGHYTGDARGIPGVEDHHYSTDGSTWSSVSVSGLPPSSFFPAITFNNVILIVGGYFYTNSAWSESNTIYSSTDGVNWAELSVSGSIWDARRLHTTLVYDDKLWILAGYSGYNRDDYWYSPDGTQWHEVMASGSKWEARQVHTSVNYAGRMWMLGGYGSTGDKQLNDVWASGLEITSFSFTKQ